MPTASTWLGQEGAHDCMCEMIQWKLAEARGVDDVSVWLYIDRDPVNECDVFFSGDVTSCEDEVLVRFEHYFEPGKAICLAYVEEEDQPEFVAAEIAGRVLDALRGLEQHA